MKHFKTISELDQAEGFPPPEHPLISLNMIGGKSVLKRYRVDVGFLYYML
jgi:hypothetical protein